MKQTIKERIELIGIYDEFTAWLVKLGFQFINSNTPADILYKMYEEKLGDTAMFGVECIRVREIDLTIRFIRAHNIPKILIINYNIDAGLPIDLVTMNIAEAKDFILHLVKMSRDRILEELQPFMKL